MTMRYTPFERGAIAAWQRSWRGCRHTRVRAVGAALVVDLHGKLEVRLEAVDGVLSAFLGGEE